MDLRSGVEAFREQMEKTADVAALYTGKLEPWTKVATGALISAGKTDFPEADFAAKGYHDGHERCEYFAVDVTGYVNSVWAPPVFVAEHENSPWRERLQYQTWKLLCIEARRRILVGYSGKGRKGYVGSFEEMVAAVREVAQAIPRRDVVLLGAPYGAEPKDGPAVSAPYEAQVVGFW
jgi:hypothetical protein